VLYAQNTYCRRIERDKRVYGKTGYCRRRKERMCRARRRTIRASAGRVPPFPAARMFVWCRIPFLFHNAIVTVLRLSTVVFCGIRSELSPESKTTRKFFNVRRTLNECSKKNLPPIEWTDSAFCD